MKHWKQSFIGILAIIALTFALGTCKNDDPTHTHDWGTWQSNATQHWQECTANDGAKTAPEAHTGNPCTVCGYETPHVQQPATITQDSGLAFDGKVIIETDDLYLDADWNAVVAQLIAAFNAAYEDAGFGQNEFKTVFGGAGAKIVLVNDLANNWEVRSGEFRTLYLKTGSIATATYTLAIIIMKSGVNPGVGKAKPAKGGVLLA